MAGKAKQSDVQQDDVKQDDAKLEEVKLDEAKLKELLFPHTDVREIQDRLIVEVEDAIKNKQSMIMHAPTGLGKTASTLPIALSYAIKKGLTVFFLTSRHTQHKIAMDTLIEIKKKYHLDFVVVDIIGKKWMCAQPGVEALYSSEFYDYCKAVREDDKCEFYSNTKSKSKASPKAQKILDELRVLNPITSERLIEIAIKEKLCPYELSLLMSNKAKVIVCDYNYVFNSHIQTSFFSKAGIELEKAILIVDEGHNLPNRMRDLMTSKLSSFILDRAIKEAKKFGLNETYFILDKIKELLKEFAEDVHDEAIIKKNDFYSKLNVVDDYDKIIADLEFIADDVRSKQKQSFIGSVAVFLESWQGEDEGFVRIISKKETRFGLVYTLSYRCLDPSIVTKPVFEKTHSNIIMSGTLTPTAMYADLFGIAGSLQKAYPNPFPDKNRLVLIVPETTTKFTARNEEQFERIAEICAEIVNAVPGNSAVFFPSYFLRDSVDRYFISLCRKTTFNEMPNMSKNDKLGMLEKFKAYNKTGAVLLGVSAGSFGEGIDLPGDLLKCVVVVGLPLQKPDLETQKLIEYYDTKFNKGWDYGYIYPAFNKCLQSAGRCIRSKDDRGVIVFLDQRFTWLNYFRLFPQDWNVKVTKEYKEKIDGFFKL